MKVTPRIPVHGPYRGMSSFVEMRYLRFGPISPVVVFLFRLLEEARLHQSTKLQSLLLEIPSNVPNNYKRWIKNMVRRDLSEQDLLLAWNNLEEDVLIIIQAIDSIVEEKSRNFESSMEAKVAIFRAKAVNIREGCPQLQCVTRFYWDEIENGVVLLYENYSMDSFVVSPCGHLQLKFSLFEQARSMLRQPATRTEFESQPIYCQRPGCQLLLSSYVFALGKTTALATATDTSSRYILNPISTSCSNPRSHEDCMYCCKARGEEMCSSGCTLCTNCVFAAFLSFSSLICPSCGHRLQKKFFDYILLAVSQVVDASPISRMNINCDWCKVKKVKDEYLCFRRIQHGCVICDSCFCSAAFRDVQFKPCKVCSQAFSDEDKEMIRSLAAQNRGNAFELCRNCQELKEDEQFSIRNSLNHQCLLCNQCVVPRSKKITNCPICNHPYNQDDVKKLKDIYKQYISKCLCGRNKKPSSIMCSKNCLCAVCLLTNFLLTKSNNCYVCGTLYCCSFPSQIKCSGCLRNLFLSKVDHDRVYAVCKSGCILCVYCIWLDKKECKCSVCNMSVDVRSREEVLRIQTQTSLGCYCGSFSGELCDLECNHKVHLKCKASVLRCRICHALYQSKPKIVKINDYIIETKKKTKS